jgi:hypothetical protein
MIASFDVASAKHSPDKKSPAILGVSSKKGGLPSCCGRCENRPMDAVFVWRHVVVPTIAFVADFIDWLADGFF